MKKFLALVLALVMTMSLVTIAGAEDYTDADSMNYAEAVEVMSAAGVVGGYADGSFNPQAGLTRGAAAKIICNMILGPTTAEALVANDAPYSDVAVDNVFAGYIAYCANEGIISGYADGTFRPAAPLTGYAFMKMLLAVLVDAEPVEDENAKGDDIFTYTVVVDGTETTLTFEKALDAKKYVAGTVFAYELDGDYAVIDTETKLLTDASVDAANDSYVEFEGTQYNLGTETVYTIYMEYEDEAAYNAKTVDTVTVEDNGVVEKEDQVVFTLKDGDLDVIFVYEYIY